MRDTETPAAFLRTIMNNAKPLSGIDISRATGIQSGSLYPILHRLEREGRIAGRWDREGGRRRKVYGLTEAGRTHLAEEGARITAASQALDRLLGGVS